MRRIRNFAVDLVSGAPARVQTKLLVAFLAMVVLLVGLGAVGLQVLGGMSQQTEELIQLEHKIAAFRQVQHATTSQLYGVASALVAPEERVLDGILRQLSQFGYDLDRLEHVAQDEALLMAQVREEYDRFIEIVTRAVELARAGQVDEAREVQRTEAGPLAERLERLTNQLVNVAEAAMLERIAASQQAYGTSQAVVAAFALGSILLALGLGYVFSWSIVGPVTEIEARLRQIAAGDFTQRVHVSNRDELGALAGDVNRTSEELGRLHRQNEERTQELSEALERQTATGEVLGVISRSTTELQPVLDTIVATAARLCHAEWAVIFKLEADRKYHLAGATGNDAEFLRYLSQTPVVPGRGTLVGRTAVEGRTVHLPDVLEDPEYAWHEAQTKGGYRTNLGVPLLRGDAVIGVISLARNVVRPFTDKEIELVTTFADQAVIAIENVRLFEEVQARTRELTEALEQQTATSAILRVISTSPTDVQPVFETIVRNAVALCGSLFANVFRFDGELLHWVASHNVGPDYVELLRAKYPMRPDASQVSGRTVLTRSVIRLEDALADPDYDHRFPAAMGWRRMLGVPMLRRGEPLGVIVVGWAEAGPVPKAQEELLKQFADQAVIAIENARLFDEVTARTAELTEALQQQTATGEVLGVISRSTTELQPVLDAIIVTAARLCRAEWGMIFKLGADGRYLPAAANKADQDFLRYLAEHPISPGRETLIGRTALEGRTVHIPDVLADPEYAWAEAQARAGFRTLLGVPLLRRGTVIGVINLHRQTVDPFSDKEIELVTTFADQALIAIENVRLFEEVQARTDELTEALERQTATGEVLSVISRSTTELQPVLDTIVATAARLCRAEWAVVFKREADGRYHLAAANASEAEFVRYMVEHPIARDQGSMVGRTALKGGPVHLRDVLEDPEYTWSEAQVRGRFRSLLGVPLLRGDAVIGVITLGRSIVAPFTDKEIDLVTTFADQAVIAIENVRLFDEVQARTDELSEALERQTATSEVLSVISRSTSELQPVLDTIVATAARLCHADWANIRKLEADGRYHLAAVTVNATDFAHYLSQHPAVPGRGTMAGRTALEGRTLHVADILEDPEYTWSEAQAKGGYRTMLGVPLLRGNAVIGVIILARNIVRPFSDKEIELVTTFADQAVIAIENVRLFDEVQARTRELTRSVTELRALSEVSQAVNSTLELQAVLTSVAAHAVTLAEADAGAFCAWDEELQAFHIQATHELDEAVVQTLAERPVRLGEGAVGRAGSERRAVQIPDIDLEPGYALYDVIRRPGYRALLAVPLLREDALVGGLVMLRKTAGAFAADAVNLVQTLANQSVLAIQNAKLFHEIELKGQQLAAANRHKSEFLANMSHELRTPLNAVLGYAELIQDGIYGEVPDKIREVMERIQQNGRHLLGLINDVLDLSKIEAGELKLAPVDYSLRELMLDVVSATEALAAEKGIELRIDAPADLPPGRGDERRLTQVLLNLVGNAIKFTEAGAVTIRAAIEEDHLVVSVTDTGPGIAEADRERIFGEFQQVDSSSTRKKGGTGLGLAIARRIVELHGGRIWVDSTPGQGATFSFTLPLSPRKQMVPA